MRISDWSSDVCSSDLLVDALWGEDPPPAVRNGLQGLVSKLRRALGSSDVVAMRGGGYALDIPPDAVDVHRYEQAVAAARATLGAGDAADAIALLGSADSLWRGRSEEHTSELQSLMRISYAVFCLKKKKTH